MWQDSYFLGFPFNLVFKTGMEINKHFPIPWCKKGIISACIIDDPTDGTMIFLDGQNNPGFSGGPIVIVDLDRKSRIIGVVSGYINDSEKKIPTPMGDLHTLENSGIVKAYSINHAIEIIKK